MLQIICFIVGIMKHEWLMSEPKQLKGRKPHRDDEQAFAHSELTY